MKVNVLFFGATADLVGARKIEAPVSETTLAADVIEQLHAQYPNLKDHALLFAVNEEYVSGDTRLKNGDELAIFTPVSGG
jgi:molybdopterin converting factor small subunit